MSVIISKVSAVLLVIALLSVSFSAGIGELAKSGPRESGNDNDYNNYVFSSADSYETDEKYDLFGMISKGESTCSVSNIKVALMDTEGIITETTTDADGNYSFGEVKTGKYYLYVFGTTSVGGSPLLLMFKVLDVEDDSAHDVVLVTQSTNTTTLNMLGDSNNLGYYTTNYGAVNLVTTANTSGEIVFPNIVTIDGVEYGVAQVSMIDGSVTKVTFPYGPTSITNGALANPSTKEAIFSDSVVKIGAHAFRNSSVEKVYVPASVTSIHTKAISNNKVLASIEFGSGSQFSFNDSDGYIYDGETQVFKLPAWVDSASKLTFESNVGRVVAYHEGNEINSGEYVNKSWLIEFELIMESHYELLCWKVTKDGITETYYNTKFILSGITADTHVEARCVYVSRSTIPTWIIDTEMPKIDDNLSLQWMFGGGIDDPSQMEWTGHPSVPLIVDNFVYVRVNENIFKIDIETGIIVASCESVNTKASYHYIFFELGMLFDTISGKVYDTDLNYIGDYPHGQVYSDGEYLYSIETVKKYGEGDPGLYIYKYNRNLEQIIVGNLGTDIIKYGSTVKFIGDYLYFFATDCTEYILKPDMTYTYFSGDERIMVSVNTDTGELKDRVNLSEMNGHLYKNADFVSYGSTIYISSYTEGLFGGGVSGSGKLATILTEDGEFKNVSYIDTGLGTRSASTLMIYEDRAYLFVHDELWAFDIKEDGVLELRYSKSVGFSHGGAVMNIHYASEDGTIYVYVLPYSSSDGVYIFSDKPGQIEGVVRLHSGLTPAQFGSQAVRSGPNGEMIWYNDAGYVYCISTEEKSSYKFLIQDGDDGHFESILGKTAAEALSKYEGIDVDSVTGEVKLNGIKMDLYYYMNFSVTQSDEFVGLDWYKANDILDLALNQYRYWVIVPEGMSIECSWEYGSEECTPIDIISKSIPAGSVLTMAYPDLEGVTISDDSISLVEDSEYTLTYVIDPTDAKPNSIVWTSSDESIATVDENGVVRGVSTGSAVITVNVDGFESSCTVTVTDKPIPVKGIMLYIGIAAVLILAILALAVLLYARSKK